MILFSAILGGAPRTKKNHGKVIQRGGRKFHVQSDAYQAWNLKAILDLKRQCDLPPFVVPINLRATFYRHAEVGDLCGYLQALGDTLENAGIIANDKLIAGFDGSRLDKDAKYPRVVVILEEAKP